MPIPSDYVERVYAGTLGKIIGVYLGRPFEGWTYEQIMADLGEIWYYVHQQRNKRLIVSDDDITGTFTFLRAMADYGCSLDLTPRQIGQTWLNYIIENRTILWWGGIGKSTEHTAFLRLKSGVSAPESGSAALNGTVTAEQIGAQIFIDGWGMIFPGEPDKAAEFARRAASVSHDGEAVYAAQVIAAMAAQAFVEPDLNALLDCGLARIPGESTIARLICDIREWHAEWADWRTARQHIAATYGYDKYPGNCHVVPNHALIVLALLYGGGDFQKSLMIVNTSGWDTDCNSGNVGCLLGIRSGLASFEGGPDWRGPVADRLYLPTADGGRSITDAVTEAVHVANVGLSLHGGQPYAPKGGARFHFELPGSVQGFQSEGESVSLRNVAGFSRAGARSLAVTVSGAPAQQSDARVCTPVFIPQDALDMRGYELVACPTLYPGQTLRAALRADSDNREDVDLQLVAGIYRLGNALDYVSGPAATVAPGQAAELQWTLDDTGGFPIASVGIQLRHARDPQTVYLDWLTWDGVPSVTFSAPEDVSRWSPVRPAWIRAWVDAVDQFYASKSHGFEVIQNRGKGIVLQGTRDWTDYAVSAAIHVHLAKAFGIGIRVQGLERYYGLIVCDDSVVRLVKALDGVQVLAAAECRFDLQRTYGLKLEAVGAKLYASIDGILVFEVEDSDSPLMGGAAAVICEEGRLTMRQVSIQPAMGSRGAGTAQ